MSSDDDEIIIRGGEPSGEYWAEYNGKRVKLSGWVLFLQRRIAAWVYWYFGA